MNGPDNRVGTRVVLENDRVRVWEEHIAVGEATPVHTHRFPFVAVILQGGEAESTGPDGTVSRRTRTAGQVLFTGADSVPFTHSVRNVSTTDIQLMIIELL